MGEDGKRSPGCRRRADADLTLEDLVECEQACHALAARLFGSLEEPERTAVDAHLHTCAFCREQYEELAEVLPLLDLVVLNAPLGGAPLQGVPVPDCDRGIGHSSASTASGCGVGRVSRACRAAHPDRPHR